MINEQAAREALEMAHNTRLNNLLQALHIDRELQNDFGKEVEVRYNPDMCVVKVECKPDSIKKVIAAVRDSMEQKPISVTKAGSGWRFIRWRIGFKDGFSVVVEGDAGPIVLPRTSAL